MAQTPDFDRMNETDVRAILVRPLIDQLGYRHGTEATVITEKTLRYEKAFLGRKNPKKDPPLVGRADYICDVITYGRWVIEVKSPTELLSQDVVEQAHTYAAHPDVAAAFFLITNGRTFRLYETAKLGQALLEWEYKDQDDNLLRVFNVLSPAAFRKRAKLTLVDPGRPLGVGLASRLRIIGGSVTYEEHSGTHPFLQPGSINGLSLPVTGGSVFRSGDKRIAGKLRVAKVTAGDQAALQRMRELLNNPQQTLATIRDHVNDSFARLYRQRNLILHAGKTRAVALRSTLRGATPLVGAGLDRICHARFVDGVTPIRLAGRARTALTTVAVNDPAGCISLLGRS